MPFTETFARAMEEPRRFVVPLLFLEITHTLLSVPLRIVRDTANYKWGGDLWYGVMFEGTIISDTENQPRARLVMQNVDRRVSAAISKIRSRAGVSMWLLSSDDFNEAVKPHTPVGTPTVEYEAVGFFLRDFVINPMEISAELTIRDLRSEPWTKRVASPDRCPGAFYGP